MPTRSEAIPGNTLPAESALQRFSSTSARSSR